MRNCVKSNWSVLAVVVGAFVLAGCSEGEPGDEDDALADEEYGVDEGRENGFGPSCDSFGPGAASFVPAPEYCFAKYEGDYSNTRVVFRSDWSGYRCECRAEGSLLLCSLVTFGGFGDSATARCFHHSR